MYSSRALDWWVEGLGKGRRPREGGAGSSEPCELEGGVGDRVEGGDGDAGVVDRVVQTKGCRLVHSSQICERGPPFFETNRLENLKRSRGLAKVCIRHQKDALKQGRSSGSSDRERPAMAQFHCENGWIFPKDKQIRG
jgi:hypothetical protein